MKIKCCDIFYSCCLEIKEKNNLGNVYLENIREKKIYLYKISCF